MRSTLLSTLLNRMNAFQKISTTEEQYLVRHLDSSLRDLKRETQLPWSLKKGTLRVFDHVFEYPVADDHDALAYLDNNNQFTTQDKARFFFTSLQQFYENQTYRNTIAEIFDNGTRYLGVRYKDFDFGSQQIDDASIATNYSANGDASNPQVDYVFYHQIDDNAANSSISFDVLANTGTAEFICQNFAYSDGEYRRKYFFVDLYLPFLPAGVELRLGSDANNYFTSGVLTTQFSGASLKTGDWNVMAFDLNIAAAVGNPNVFNFNYFDIVITGATTGKYYVGQSWARQWDLLDYYYYSCFNIQTNGSLVPNQEYFYSDDDSSYSLDSSLVCDHHFTDIVMYDACILALADKEDQGLVVEITKRRDDAWDKLLRDYPSMRPLIITSKWNFDTEYNEGSKTLII